MSHGPGQAQAPLHPLVRADCPSNRAANESKHAADSQHRASLMLHARAEWRQGMGSWAEGQRTDVSEPATRRASAMALIPSTL